MSFQRAALSLVVVSLVLVPLRGQQRADRWTRVTPMTSPAAAGSGEPGLVSDGKGRVWLSWLEPADGGVTKFRVAALGASTTPVTIAEGKNFFVNWADVPAVFRATDGSFTAHWLERGGANKGAYDIKLASSRDAVRWSPVGTPHRDGVEAEHGFVSFFNYPGNGTGMIWLDGRNMAAGHGDHMAAGAASTMLRTTRIAADAKGAVTLGEDRAIDPRICDCCSTSAATTSDGVIVAYRDRSDKEVRDISVSRFDGKTWSAPATVHADNWEINACPVNGPVITANGKTVAVAWFTQAGGTAHSKIAFSIDGGRTFGAPITLDAGTTFGRLGMVMPDARTVLVSSIERSASGETSLLVRQVTTDGRVQPPVTVANVSSERASGFPRLALDRDRVVIAWTTVSSGRASGVQVAALR